MRILPVPCGELADQILSDSAGVQATTSSLENKTAKPLDRAHDRDKSARKGVLTRSAGRIAVLVQNE